MRKLLWAATAAWVMGGCATTSQYTSGADYLAKYDQEAYQTISSIDQDVRDIANIEPHLSFPARIGLARIENGQLSSVPMDEAQSWQNMISDLGSAYGAFIPVSPMVAAMVARPSEKATRALSVVNDIRRGSALQHLDHVLIYEVSEKSDKQSNALRLADLTVLGLFVLPSRDVKIDASASAMLLDVRNGYPYGTATAFSDLSSMTTAAGSRKAKAKLSDRARRQVVRTLTQEVTVFMEALREKSAV